MAEQFDNSYRIGTEVDLSGLIKGLQEIKAKVKAVRFDTINNSGIKQTEKDLKSATNASDLFSVSAGKIKPKQDASTGSVNKFNRSLGSTRGALEDVSRRVFIWGSMSAAIFGALQALKEFYDFVLKVETAVAELKKVLPRATDFAGLTTEAFNISIQFGAVPLDTLQILKRFAQSGLDAKESIEATRTALLGLNVTGAGTEEVFNAIIGANKIFGVEFEKSASIIDKVQKVQANFAIDSKDLIASIQGIGPAISAFGGNIDDLFGNIAALGEAARVSGREAANSLKRVLSRLGSEEGVQALQALGVQVYATADTFRPLRDILTDLNTKLKTASQVQKTNTAITLAQVRQYTKLLALLENYERALAAIEDSETAAGEATDANRVVLETYQKQLDVANAKIQKFVNDSVSGAGGVASAWSEIKILFADIVSTLGGGIAPLVSLIAVFGGLALALKIAKPVLFGMNKDVSAAIKGYSLLELRTASVARGLKELTVAQRRSVITTAAWTSTLFFATAAILAIAAAYSYFGPSLRRNSQLIKQSTEDFKAFKNSLEGITFAGIADRAVQQKFDTLLAVVNSFAVSAKEGTLNADEFASAIGGLFLGQTKNLTSEQLNTLATQLENINNDLKRSVLAPYFDAVGQKVSEITPKFNALTEALENNANIFATGNRLVPTEFEAELRKIVKLQEQLVTAAPTDVPKLLSAFDNMANSVRDAVIEIADYKDQLALLEKQTERTAEEQRKYNELTAKSESAAKSAAQQIADLIGPTRLYEAALKKVDQIAADTFVQDRKRSQAAALSDITKELTKILLENAEVYGKQNSEIYKAFILSEKFQKELKKLAKAADENKGVFAIDFSTVDILAGVKKTTSAIVDGFNTQLRAIQSVNLDAAEFGKIFDQNKESLKAVDNAINKITTTLSSNAEEVGDLRLEYQAIETLYTQLSTRKDIVPIDQGKMQELQSRLTNINTRLQVTQAINEQNSRQYQSQIRYLIGIKRQLEEVAKAEKLREAAIKAQLDLQIGLADKYKELNSITIQSPFELLAANSSVFDDILKAQLKYYDTLVAAGYEEKSIADVKKQELIYQEAINKETRKLDAVLSAIKEEYDRIDSTVGGVRSTIHGLIADQDRFFDDLTSRGSAFEILSRGLSGIASAVTESDADIIADRIANSTRSVMENANKDLQSLRDEFQTIAKGEEVGSLLSERIQTAIQNSSTLFSADINAAVSDLGGKISAPINTAGDTLDTTLRGTFDYGASSMKSAVETIITKTIDGLNKLSNTEVEKTSEQVSAVIDKSGKDLGDAWTQLLNQAQQGPPVSSYNVGYDGMAQKEKIDNYISQLVTLGDAIEGKGQHALYSPDLHAGVTRSTQFQTDKLNEMILNSKEDSKRFEKLLSFGDTTEFHLKDIKIELQKVVQNTGVQAVNTDPTAEDVRRKNLNEALARQIGLKLGQAIGVSIANANGVRAGDVSFGSNLGATAGFIAGGPTGAAVGGAFGAILGGIFGRKEDAQQQTDALIAIRDNTSALVDRLSPEIINAPSTFSTPSGNSASGSVVIQNNITLNGNQLDSGTVSNLRKQLNDVYSRSSGSISPLE